MANIEYMSYCLFIMWVCGAKRAGLMNELKIFPVPVFWYFVLLVSTGDLDHFSLC